MPSTQSIVAIWNMALGHVGRSTKPVASTNELSVEARMCAVYYDQVRQECLEQENWSFARTRGALAIHGDAPPPNWSYRYAMPANALTFRGFWNPLTMTGGLMADGSGTLFNQTALSTYYGDLSNAVPFELEASNDGTNMTILTNLGNAIGEWTIDQQLVQMFSPGFVKALALTLGSYLAYPLAGKQQISDNLKKEAMQALHWAAGADMNQAVEATPRDGYAGRARA